MVTAIARSLLDLVFTPDESPEVSLIDTILLKAGVVPYEDSNVEAYKCAVHAEFAHIPRSQWLVTQVIEKDGVFNAGEVPIPSDVQQIMSSIVEGAKEVGEETSFEVHHYRVDPILRVTIGKESRFGLSWNEYRQFLHLLTES